MKLFITTWFPQATTKCFMWLVLLPAGEVLQFAAPDLERLSFLGSSPAGAESDGTDNLTSRILSRVSSFSGNACLLGCSNLPVLGRVKTEIATKRSAQFLNIWSLLDALTYRPQLSGTAHVPKWTRHFVPFLVTFRTHLQSPSGCVACVRSGRRTGPTGDTRLTETVRLGNSSRPHTRAPPPTPSHSVATHHQQPHLRAQVQAQRNRISLHLVRRARRPAGCNQSPIEPTTGRRRVSVLFPGRRTADGRQAATPRDDRLRAGRPLAWRASARWLAGPSKGQGGVAESARPANNLPPMPMPVADPNNLPPVATLFKPLLPPPFSSGRA